MMLNKKSNKKIAGMAIKISIALILFAAITEGIYFGKLPHVQNIKEGDVSSSDIYSPFDFTLNTSSESGLDIKRGELILAQGSRAKSDTIIKIDYINNHRAPFTARSVSGIAIVVATLILIVGIYLAFYEPKLFIENKNVLLIGLLMLLFIIIAKVAIAFHLPIYLIPTSFIPILVTMLINPRLAIIITMALAVISGVVISDMSIGIVTIVSGIMGIYAIHGARHRSHIIKAGAVVGCLNFAFIFGLNSLDNIPINITITNASWGLASGIFSAFLAAGLLPFLEYIFRMITNISLLELADLNHPLLKEMVVKAPGTYHHSLVVGNLAEAACDAIHANSLLARVGAYYHDIGKIEKADYFSENQIHNGSKHDKLTPTMSSLIITSHVKDGIDIAKKYNLNSKILDFIGQHHGTSLIFYFYHRALEEIEDESQVKEEGFRYEGPKPQTKEAAVVLLADSVEAASRALSDPTPGRLRSLVQKIINNKFIDGQLDECDLTLKNLNAIANTFTHILTGIFHTRVNYPSSDDEESR